MPSLINDPLRLACGQVLQNRLAKAAMTEGLADPRNQATERHARLYDRWGKGGMGLLLTGNIQVDRRHLERAGNVVLDGVPSDAHLANLKAWVSAATRNGSQVWAQISHAGRQTPKSVNPTPLAPSAVKLGLPGGQFGDPRAMSADEVNDVVQRFAHTASVCRDVGFGGVQIHAAHGYLISEFLSPRVNHRTDDWGGSLQNRARLLLDTVRAVRAKTGPDFAISVKLNSADFQHGGFSNEECLIVVEWLNAAGIDLLEISGGNYEQPKMAGLDGVDAASGEKLRESTRAREAYFMSYAEAISRVAKMPLMVTGGFRTRTGMEEALSGGACQVIGIGRPLCGDPLSAKRVLTGEADSLPSYESRLRIGPGWLGPNSPITLLKMINGWGAQGWYCLQLLRMGNGQDPDLRMGVLQAFRQYAANETEAAKKLMREA